jgi:hypothetical protein
LRKIPVLKRTLLLLHVMTDLNQMGPTHTQIFDIYLCHFLLLKLTHFFYENFNYYIVFQKKNNFDKILKFVEDEQYKYLVLESIDDNYYGVNLKNKLERKTVKRLFWATGHWLLMRMSL